MSSQLRVGLAQINPTVGDLINNRAQGMKDMGKVMKEVNAQVAGKADGKLVSDLVRARLSA